MKIAGSVSIQLRKKKKKNNNSTSRVKERSSHIGLSVVFFFFIIQNYTLTFLFVNSLTKELGYRTCVLSLCTHWECLCYLGSKVTDSWSTGSISIIHGMDFKSGKRKARARAFTFYFSAFSIFLFFFVSFFLRFIYLPFFFYLLLLFFLFSLVCQWRQQGPRGISRVRRRSHSDGCLTRFFAQFHLQIFFSFVTYLYVYIDRMIVYHSDQF